MKCLVCQATWPDDQGAHCPHCQYDATAADARDPNRIAAARQAMRERTTAYAPHSRVTRWDRLQPWAAVLLAFALFAIWLRTCSSCGPL